MALTTKNLTAEQGTTFNQYVQFVDNSRLPVNISGWRLYGQIQKTYTTANITAAFSITPVDYAQGNLLISLSANTTTLIPAGRYVYNIFGAFGEKIEKIEEGIITFNPSTIATGLQFNGYAGNTVPYFIDKFIQDSIAANIANITTNVESIQINNNLLSTRMSILDLDLTNTVDLVQGQGANIRASQNGILSTATPEDGKLDFVTANVSILDVSKRVQKLGQGYYRLPDGVDGQIMYFVPTATGLATNTYVQFANARVFLSGGTLYTQSDYALGMFRNDQGTSGTFPYETVVTAIYTDGAWQTSGMNGFWC